MKKLLIKFCLVLTLALGMVSVSSNAVGQCAMCKKSAEDANSQNETRIASSINDGVLYLLAMPYLAIGVVGYIWYRNHKKAQA